ncbi:MAG: hypothetical protein PVI21_02800 [Candidatus Woesebacteria bacterium]|jgi:hypothetical protein
MKKALIVLLMFLASFGMSASLVDPVAAAPVQAQFAVCASGDFFGFPSWDSCLPKKADGSPAINSLSDVWLIAFPIVESIIRAAAYIAVGFIIWGGIKFIKSQGDPGEIAQARLIIQNAIIGLVICILSVTVVRFIADRF